MFVLLKFIFNEQKIVKLIVSRKIFKIILLFYDTIKEEKLSRTPKLKMVILLEINQENCFIYLPDVYIG